jgi:hydrophobe/amphiphile efflux-1 (HAE1) family protein
VRNFFIDRPNFAIVLSLFIVIVGLISAFNLPIAQYPQIVPPRVNVNTSYSGANSEVVEQSIAQLLEQQINGVQDMVEMQSTSQDNGYYSLNVKFELGKNEDMSLVQIQNAVAQTNANMPQEAQQNGIIARKVTPDTILYFVLWSPNGTYDRVLMKNYATININDEIRRIKGVGNVNEYGADFGMRIWLQPDKMAQLGITTSDIYDAIQKQNVQAPAGTIGQAPYAPGQEFQYTGRVKGRLAEEGEFEKIIIRAKSDGSLVRLSDVSKVELGGRHYAYSSDFNGKDAVLFGVQLTPDANAFQTVAQVKKVIERAKTEFPSDLQCNIGVDNTSYVDESLREVVKTFGGSIFLVLVIVFIFLGSWRATLIPMLAIPVSLIGTFGAFLLLGFSINTLTLFAMVLAVGLVVDDAIVVVEAVERHIRYNKLSPREATKQAMGEVTRPVIAIAFVLAAVFIPVAFMGGTVGVLYKQFALTIVVSMVLSAFVALTTTPALCTMLLRPHDPQAYTGTLGKMLESFNTWFERMLEKYEIGVGWAIQKTRLCMMMLLVLMVMIGMLIHILPSSFVPNEDQGNYIAAINLPEGATMSRTREVANSVCEIFADIPGVESSTVFTGYDVLADAGKPNAAGIFVLLKPWSERQTPELQIENQIRTAFMNSSQISEAMVLVFGPPTLPGVGSYGGFTFMLQDKTGGNVEELDDISQQFIAAARQRPEIGLVYSTFRTDTPGYHFEVDREKAMKLGIQVKDVFNALQTFLSGLEVNDFNRFGRTYKVVMQAEAQYRSNVDATRFLFLRSAAGEMIPLNTLLKAVPINAPSVIKRFNGFRAVQIGGNPAPGYSSGQAMAALEEVAAQTLPLGFSYEWAEQSRDEKISGKRAPIVFGFALLFVFLCLIALYESWIVPFAVLLSVPTAIFGSFLFQYLRNLENNIYMQIGLVMLIGLTAKNAILIVEFAKVRVDHGMDPIQAAIEGAKLRLRPILMTSMAFILGCIPLAIATGAGAGARISMGTSVIGGMLVATAMGIFIIPVLYVVVERLAKGLTDWKQGFDRGGVGEKLGKKS